MKRILTETLCSKIKKNSQNREANKSEWEMKNGDWETRIAYITILAGRLFSRSYIYIQLHQGNLQIAI